MLQVSAQALAREVAYELIPFSQRRRLHAAVAESQETALRRGDTGPQAPTAANIAYNYSAACATVELTEWRHALLVRHRVTTQEHCCTHRSTCLQTGPQCTYYGSSSSAPSHLNRLLYNAYCHNICDVSW